MNGIENKELKKRIIEISWKHTLSHLGSCLTAVDIIDEIFKIKKKDEKFVLSSGHAGLALYCVLEKYGGRNAEEIFNHHGVHPDRCDVCGINCSTGSLAQGLPIAVGMALADRSKNVYCLISDGECAEGSIWEALRIVEDKEIKNLCIFVNFNGFGAYAPIHVDLLKERMRAFDFFGEIEFWDTNVEQLPFLKGQDAHYYIMTEGDYKQAMEILK